MSRYRSASSYGHQIKYSGDNCFLLSWVVDFYYPSSRLRHPRVFTRYTDEAGAARFAAKWALEFHPSVGREA